MTGVNETPATLGDDDRSKVNAILTVIAPDAVQEVVEVKRLGTQRDDQTRPMLVSFRSKEMRDYATQNSNALKKYKGVNKETNAKIFVKKDKHPAWRREYSRLNKLVRDEQRKPENQGIKIEYDYKERVVLRAGMVIDRFNPFI
jgi:hypothetical protein